ncbi:MAG: ABC transporter permease [Eubacteriales bacterium]|jgi:rhamnose transport system permease protein|nr:ABC transporter permease [Eubacteriales bacterium]MDD3110174.1 ABC transporter permease [Eubacteriales bacterium]MDD3572056.1 ABC transporter permease [Eubacteriales bacterium]MDD4134601.1 ABC transporter permease [Eubacteriales bacterium]NLO14087.1 ABC transporter permease [Clostridiales bacterium]
MPEKTRKPGALSALFKQREVGLFIILAVLFLLVGLRNPAFTTGSNALFILEDTAIMMILALGMLCVLLVGSIDISIAAIMALSTMTAGIVMKQNLNITEIQVVTDGVMGSATLRESTPLILLVIIGMGVGALCGALNGLLIAYGRVLPIVATLGMQYILYGVSHVVSDGQAVYRKDMPDSFINLSRQAFLGLNSKIWFMLVVFAVMFLFLTYSRQGRYLYAVGSNRESAAMSGIKSPRATLIAHIIMGMLAGLAGLLYASRDTKITQDMAMGYEMYIIASCVIGGVSVSGGRGKAVGVLLGALTMGVINNALTMLRLTGNSEFWKKAIQGALILAAVVINVIIQRSKERRVLRDRRI